MKGRSPTAAQKRFHDLLCQHVGCIACRKEGLFNSWVSVHHVDGRTKPEAHWLVLPLCAGHHQDGTGGKWMIAVHPIKPDSRRNTGASAVCWSSVSNGFNHMNSRFLKAL